VAARQPMDGHPHPGAPPRRARRRPRTPRRPRGRPPGGGPGGGQGPGAARDRVQRRAGAPGRAVRRDALRARDGYRRRSQHALGVRVRRHGVVAGGPGPAAAGRPGLAPVARRPRGDLRHQHLPGRCDLHGRRGRHARPLAGGARRRGPDPAPSRGDDLRRARRPVRAGDGPKAGADPDVQRDPPLRHLVLGSQRLRAGRRCPGGDERSAGRLRIHAVPSRIRLRPPLGAERPGGARAGAATCQRAPAGRDAPAVPGHPHHGVADRIRRRHPAPVGPCPTCRDSSRHVPWHRVPSPRAISEGRQHPPDPRAPSAARRRDGHRRGRHTARAVRQAHPIRDPKERRPAADGPLHARHVDPSGRVSDGV
ncbi:MAG: CBM32, partial [uncultured Solirubrobacteraceae bacterium]